MTKKKYDKIQCKLWHEKLTKEECKKCVNKECSNTKESVKFNRQQNYRPVRHISINKYKRIMINEIRKELEKNTNEELPDRKVIDWALYIALNYLKNKNLLKNEKAE